jgi:hypothetical protein
VAREQRLVPRLAELARAARAAGVRVVHCTAAFRPDGAGSAANAPILAAAVKHRSRLLLGSPEADPVLALGPEPRISCRFGCTVSLVWSAPDSTQCPQPRDRQRRARRRQRERRDRRRRDEAVDLGYRAVIPRTASSATRPSAPSSY